MSSGTTIVLETVDDLDRFEIAERSIRDLLEISQSFAAAGRPAPRYIMLEIEREEMP